MGFEIIFLFVICAINKTNTGQWLFYIESPELYFGVKMFFAIFGQFCTFYTRAFVYLLPCPDRPLTPEMVNLCSKAHLAQQLASSVCLKVNTK